MKWNLPYLDNVTVQISFVVMQRFKSFGCCTILSRLPPLDPHRMSPRQPRKNNDGRSETIDSRIDFTSSHGTSFFTVIHPLSSLLHTQWCGWLCSTHQGRKASSACLYAVESHAVNWKQIHCNEWICRLFCNKIKNLNQHFCLERFYFSDMRKKSTRLIFHLPLLA